VSREVSSSAKLTSLHCWIYVTAVVSGELLAKILRESALARHLLCPHNGMRKKRCCPSFGPRSFLAEGPMKLLAAQGTTSGATRQ